MFRYQEKKQKSRSKKLDSGSLREISKLLAKEGAVTGKGEIIEKQQQGKAAEGSSKAAARQRQGSNKAAARKQQ